MKNEGKNVWNNVMMIVEKTFPVCTFSRKFTVKVKEKAASYLKFQILLFKIGSKRLNLLETWLDGFGWFVTWVTLNLEHGLVFADIKMTFITDLLILKLP